jgi:aspartate/methionine/tyrosine aminotransferase
VLPGTAFGQAGKGFLRLAYTQGEADLRTGLQRIAAYLEEQAVAAHG